MQTQTAIIKISVVRFPEKANEPPLNVGPKKRKLKMTDEKKTVDARLATKHAFEYLKLMMPQADGILLEEVEQINGKWFITLSFQLNLSGRLPSASLPGLPFAMGTMGKREYKTFTIDVSTGEVLSMKIKRV